MALNNPYEVNLREFAEQIIRATCIRSSHHIMVPNAEDCGAFNCHVWAGSYTRAYGMVLSVGLHPIGMHVVHVAVVVQGYVLT